MRIPVLRDELRAWEDHNAALAATGGAFAVAGIVSGTESMAGESMVSALAFLLGDFPPECRPLELVQGETTGDPRRFRRCQTGFEVNLLWPRIIQS